MLHHSRLWAAAVIIGVIVVGGFVLSVPRAREVFEGPKAGSTATALPSVVMHDVFRKGTHTITGSVVAPNACARVSATASVEGDHILLALAVSEEGGVCLQVPTSVMFSTSVAAPLGTPIRASVNGTLATTTSS